MNEASPANLANLNSKYVSPHYALLRCLASKKTHSSQQMLSLNASEQTMHGYKKATESTE